MLSDIAEYIKHLVEIAKAVPLETLAVVLFGTASVGALAGWQLHNWLQRPLLDGPPPPPCDCDHILRLQRQIADNADGLWGFHPSALPLGVLNSIHDGPMRVIVFVNLKGGVAKTTTTANLAAYYAKMGLNVLAIDLDFQGSLSAALLTSAGQAARPSDVDAIIEKGTETVIRQAVSLGKAFGRLKVLTAADSLNTTETRTLLSWLLEPTPSNDIRFNLARFLASSEVRAEKFDLVLIDTPPRLTISTINALAAATHFVIPTIPDTLSIANIGSLVGTTKRLFSSGLNPRLRLAGVVRTMTSGANLRDYEREAFKEIMNQIEHSWGETPHIFKAHIPDRAGVGRLAGLELPVLSDGGTDGSAQFFEAVAKELLEQPGMKGVMR